MDSQAFDVLFFLVCRFSRRGLCQAQTRAQNHALLASELGAGGVNPPNKLPGRIIYGHFDTGTHDPFCCDDGTFKTASDDIVRLNMKLSSEPSAVASKSTLCQRRIPHFAGDGPISFDFQRERKVCLLAPRNDDLTAALPVTHDIRHDSSIASA